MSKLDMKEILERANEIYRQEQRDRLGSYIRGGIESYEVLAVLKAMVEAVNEKFAEQASINTAQQQLNNVNAGNIRGLQRGQGTTGLRP